MQSNFAKVEYLLIDDSEESGSSGEGNRSLARVLRSTESNILGASKELKDIVIESGHMAESLFERVNDGYTELTVSHSTELGIPFSRYFSFLCFWGEYHNNASDNILWVLLLMQ